MLEGVTDQSKRLAGVSCYIKDIHQQLTEYLMRGDANFDQQIWVDKREVKSGSSLFLWGKWDHDSSVTVSWPWKCLNYNTLLKEGPGEFKKTAMQLWTTAAIMNPFLLTQGHQNNEKQPQIEHDHPTLLISMRLLWKDDGLVSHHMWSVRHIFPGKSFLRVNFN